MQLNERLTVVLDAQTWDMVMRVLAKAPVPYEVVAPLITEIQGQCARQAAEKEGPRKLTEVSGLAG